MAIMQLHAEEETAKILPIREEATSRVKKVEVVIPVYNGAHVLAGSIARLYDFLDKRHPYRWRILIADNASTDGTLEVAQQLALELPRVRVLHLDEKGRGRATSRTSSTCPSAGSTTLPVSDRSHALSRRGSGVSCAQSPRRRPCSSAAPNATRCAVPRLAALPAGNEILKPRATPTCAAITRASPTSIVPTRTRGSGCRIASRP